MTDPEALWDLQGDLMKVAESGNQRFYWRWVDDGLDIASDGVLLEDEWRKEAESVGGTLTKIGVADGGVTGYRITGPFAKQMHMMILRDVEPALKVDFAVHAPRHARAE